MLPTDAVVELSRLQFGLTALYHFLFVPLTLGLAWILLIMESVYVMTGKVIYKDMTRFWGKLFGINFAMGVVTGITLEFQFGQNWAYYSYYIGDVFGIPLAIEGIVAFMLESAFFGIFFFGWDRLSKLQHLSVTFMLAIGSSLSALFILVANAWMQHPVGAEFNYHTMRMELTSFSQIFFNPVAQVKFVHTVSAGYVTGALFVLAISAYYLLKGRDITFAKHSFAVAAGFGLASVLSVLVLGDESGYTLGDVQKSKMAAIESEWNTEKPPAPFTLFGIPNQAAERTDYAVRVPWALGLIATRSFDEPVMGLRDIIQQNEGKIRQGRVAYADLQKLRQGDQSEATKAEFDMLKDNLGYGLLLKQYTPNVVDATDDQIKQAARNSIPNVFISYFSFRIMVACGLFMLALIAAAFYFCARRTVWKKRWFLWLIVWSLPLPWIASEFGWIVAEMGRQPWTIGGILPTRLSASSLQPHQLYFSLAGFFLFYTFLFIVEIFLMVKYARLGPSSLGTGRYHFEHDHPKTLPGAAS
jgi:cytochrome bd ubiquinol oxidase subunit I